jgi:DNA-binding IclR family transcriptional regulator
MPSAGAALKHTIPVIDRMMEVLGHLERQGSDGVTIRELTLKLSLPRTTVYRILNTLQSHDVVRRDDDGAYHLGRRLLSMAAHVSANMHEVDLAVVGQPFLDRLAAAIGEGIKLSVVDQDGILVLATARGRREYALTVVPGQRMPIHAGAAGKLLLAHLPPTEQSARLARPLTAFTKATITDTRRLKTELTRIRRQGWAQDKGESAPSIEAFAAPVFARDGGMVAALSIPFLAGTSAARMEEIRAAAVDAARAMSAAMPA